MVRYFQHEGGDWDISYENDENDSTIGENLNEDNSHSRKFEWKKKPEFT